MSRALSVLFTPHKVGALLAPNRFIRSPIFWGDADSAGLPSAAELAHCTALAKGGVGLIVPGFMYSLQHGAVLPGQCGFSSDAHADAWAPTVRQIHSLGSKIVFQIGHAGVRSDPTVIRDVPRGAWGFLPGTRAMSIPEIEDLVESFSAAAKRLVRIGADGLMIHCAHGYGLSQFLSPCGNQRTDRYGGSVENRVRIVREIAAEIRKVTPPSFALLCKINGHDAVEGGVTPDLCAKYVRLIRQDGVDLFEISTGFNAGFVMSRAILKEGRSVRNAKEGENERYRALLKAYNPDFPFSDAYTAPYAEVVRSVNPGVVLAIVGGNRRFAEMEALVKGGKCEFVSLGRPLIRDPNLVNRLKSGEIEKVGCVSCNQCFLRLPTQCLFPAD
jgi:2,4-dienoyl-CoA reductase-like NADH-dependent reductase (Old Yellow Enzyme family)